MTSHPFGLDGPPRRAATARGGDCNRLTSEEAQRRLAQQGPNTITEAKGPSMVRRFVANFAQPLELLLRAAAVLALLAKEPLLTATDLRVWGISGAPCRWRWS